MLKASLQKRGFNGKLLAHVILWHPNPASRMTAYQSNNEYTIGKQLDIMEALGFDGVIVTWQGVGVAFQHAAAMEFSRQTADRSMLFALLLDPAVVAQRLPNVTIEQALAAQLSHPDPQLMFNRPSYIPEKAVFDFDTNANFDVMAKQFPQLQFWKRHYQYSWPETVYVDAAGQHTMTPAQVIEQLTTDNSRMTMKAPGIFPRFFDGGLLDAKGVPDFSKGAWPVKVGQVPKPARIVHSMAGQTYHDSVRAIGLAISTVPYLCFVTWNDYTEGSEGEAFFSMVSGIRIS